MSKLLSFLCLLTIALAQYPPNDYMNLNNVVVSYDPLAQPWWYLPYDSPNFACDHFENLCGNYLEEIGCAPESQLNQGCVNGDMHSFYGTCICQGNPVYQDRSDRISEQMIDNRIKSEIGWMLEPWTQGPPFSVTASYIPICELLLHRLGCPQDLQMISLGNSNGTVANVCQCGANFTASSGRIEELICDKANEAILMETPIWSDPYNFSVEFSMAIVMVVGKIFSAIASFFYLPPILGFLLGGMSIQDIISNSLIKGAGGNGPHSTPFGEMRIFALIIVLMRAGITLNPKELLDQGFSTTALSILPYFVEFACELGFGLSYLSSKGWSVIDVGLMCSIIAALSPSLVIPGKLYTTVLLVIINLTFSTTVQM